MPGFKVKHKFKKRIDTTMDVDKLNMANVVVEVLVKMMEFRWFYRPSVYQVLRSDSTFGPLSLFNCVYLFHTPSHTFRTLKKLSTFKSFIMSSFDCESCNCFSSFSILFSKLCVSSKHFF